MAAAGAHCAGKLGWLPLALTALAAIGVLVFALTFDWHGKAAARSPSSLRGGAGSVSGPRGDTTDVVEGCQFESPPTTAFIWDPACTAEGRGCKADGKNLPCRVCGAHPLIPCPTNSTSSTTPAPVEAATAATAAIGEVGTTTTTLATTTRTTTVAVVTTVAEEVCTSLYSDVAFNTLRQSFPSNPDTQGTGFLNCRACNSGHISCNATVFGGRTRLIASHIHRATDGDGVNGVGAPVFNFCGDNTAGLINDGVPYSATCSAYKNGLASMVGMEGSLVKVSNAGMTAADRVRDLLAHPERYYFNFHSVASWAYWRTQPLQQGMCRGQLLLSRTGGHGGRA